MAEKTESKRRGEIVRFEADSRYCRETKTVLDGQVMTVGKLAKLNSSSKAVALDAAGVNEVQTIVFGASATGGTFKLGFTLSNGAIVWTDTMAWSATDATFLSNINAAIDDLLGASKVVATARSAVDTDLGIVLTFSGTGYAALPQALVLVDTAALTSVTTVTVTRTTAGHAVGGDVSMICLDDTSPSGADGSAVFLVRGPAIVDIDQCTIPTSGKTAAVAALKLLGILGISEPTKYTEV